MAISKVILNGDTLMDVTSNTVTAETLKTGYTATKNDGTSITGEYKPKLQSKEVVLEDSKEMYVPGGNIAATSSYTLNAGQHNAVDAGTGVQKLQTIDTSKKYNIFGLIKIVDTEGNLLKEISVNDTIDPTTTGTQYVDIPSNNYIVEISISNITASAPLIYIRYFSGTFGFSSKLYIVENEEEYEGLASVNVQLDGVYGIYKCIAEKSSPLTPLGSTSYGYTSTDITNWCNSFSSIRLYQFADVWFSTNSFYFNNVTTIGYYGFAKAFFNTDTGVTYYPDFYFPEMTSMSAVAFACNTLSYIDAPKCTVIPPSAFKDCSRLTNVNFPLCVSIDFYAFNYATNLSIASFPKCSYIGSSAFQQCTKLSIINFPECTTIGFYAFGSCNQLSNVEFPLCTMINSYAFCSCKKLQFANFPECISISNYAFYYCSSLASISFPKCEIIGTNAFQYCLSLTMVNFPKCSSIGSFAFGLCSNLSIASFPNCSIIYNYAFTSCYNLLSLYLMNSSYVTLNHTNAFNSTPISNYTTSTNGVYGSIYVPSSMLDTYKTMSNWSVYSSRFVGI